MSERSGEPAVIIERRSEGGFGLFLLGAALGAGLALLFAPQAGEETRAELRRTARKVKRRARDLADSGRDAAEELVRTGRDAARDIADSGRDAVRQMKRTGRSAAREAREALEERLARHRESFGDADDGV